MLCGSHDAMLILLLRIAAVTGNRNSWQHQHGRLNLTGFAYQRCRRGRNAVGEPLYIPSINTSYKQLRCDVRILQTPRNGAICGHQHRVTCTHRTFTCLRGLCSQRRFTTSNIPLGSCDSTAVKPLCITTGAMSTHSNETLHRKQFVFRAVREYTRQRPTGYHTIMHVQYNPVAKTHSLCRKTGHLRQKAWRRQWEFLNLRANSSKTLQDIHSCLPKILLERTVLGYSLARLIWDCVWRVAACRA